MALFSAVEVFNVGDIFFFLLKSDVDIYCKKVLALPPLLSMPKTSLVVLVLFLVGGGYLIGGRYLLPIRYVSRGHVGGLIFLGVFILLFC